MSGAWSEPGLFRRRFGSTPILARPETSASAETILPSRGAADQDVVDQFTLAFKDPGEPVTEIIEGAEGIPFG